MADWTLKQQWSLNGQVVPLAQGKGDIEDIWNLTETGSVERVDLFFLNLKGTAGPWMDKVLQLKPKSWFYHSGTVPFLQEVREAILKAQSECAYLTKASVLVLQIRDKALKAQNDLRSVRLVFEEAEMKEKLIWCLKEILQDIQGQEPRDPGAPKAKKRNQESIAEHKDLKSLEDEHIEDCIADFKSHDGCEQAVFCESRRAFKVRRKDNVEKLFTVKGLSKKRKLFKAYRGLEEQLDDEHYKDLENSFIAAVRQAKDWLDGCPMACLDE